MPWNPAQHRLFEWVKHNPEAAHRAGYHIKQSDASRMAHEGIKRCSGGLAQMACGGQPMASGGVPTSMPINPLDTSPGGDIAMILGNFGAVQPRTFAAGGPVSLDSVQDAQDMLKQ